MTDRSPSRRLPSTALAAAVCALAGARALAEPPPPKPGKPSSTDKPAAGKPSTDEARHVTARLISEQAALVPGQTAMLGVSLTIEKGWHVYWNGLNETGVPVSATFQLPEGFKAGDMQWPAPVRYIAPGDLLDHVYFDRVTLLVPVEVPSGAKSGSTYTLRASLNWLVCKETCIPESADVELTLPVAADGQAPGRSADADLIQASRARLPRPLRGTPGGAAVKVTWSEHAVTIEAPGAKGVSFYPYETSASPANLIRDGESATDTLNLSIDARGQVKDVLDGVLEVRGGGGAGPTFYRVRETRLAPAGRHSSIPPVPGPGAPPLAFPGVPAGGPGAVPNQSSPAAVPRAIDSAKETTQESHE